MDTYIVERLEIGTDEKALQEYLNSKPHSGYTLKQIVSVTSGNFGIQHYVIVWVRT